MEALSRRMAKVVNSESMRADSPLQSEERDLTMAGIAMLSPGESFSEE